jgi:Flp pilus assembly protein TadD
VTRWWERAWIGPVIAAIAMMLYAPTVFFEKIGFDDEWLWAEDSPLRHLGSRLVRDIFVGFGHDVRHALGGEYLPVRDLVVSLDMAVWGHNEHGPHITQLVLFGLLVWGLGTLLVRWKFPRPVAWMATLLWAVHPLVVQSVAWMSERKGILAALFAIACGHAWVRYRERGRLGMLTVACVSAVCAVWSKAPGMFAPAVFAAWDLLLLPRARSRWIAIVAVGAAVALAALPVVYVASRTRVIADEAGATGGVDVSRPVAALGAQGHYVQSALLVRAPSLSYPIQSYGPSVVDLVFGVLALLASIAVAYPRGESRPLRLALLAWAWIWFVPISHLIAPVHILVADRYAFLWLVGPCLGAALAIERLSPTPRLAVFSVLVCVTAVSAIRAEQAWTNSIELFGRGCQVNPRDPQMCENLAGELERAGAVEQALAAADRGLAATPKEPRIEMRKAQILWENGAHDAALVEAERGAESGLSSAAWRYAVLLEMAGRPRDAIWWARRAAEYHPEMETYQRTYATVLGAVGDYQAAEWPLRLSIANPHHTPAVELRLAEVLIHLHRYQEARAWLAIAAKEPALANAVRQLEQRLPP